jgi:hypothetical protein
MAILRGVGLLSLVEAAGNGTVSNNESYATEEGMVSLADLSFRSRRVSAWHCETPIARQGPKLPWGESILVFRGKGRVCKLNHVYLQTGGIFLLGRSLAEMDDDELSISCLGLRASSSAD